MDAGLIDRIETGAERLASALFGGAVGYAAYMALAGLVSLPELAVCAGAGAMVAHLLCGRLLSTLASRGSRFKVLAFDVREIETSEPSDELLLTDEHRVDDELILTDADRLQSPDELVLGDEDRLLVLDDVLAEIGRSSRVVQLFDRQAMPSPGQLKSKIDDHLEQTASATAQSDASQALSDALAELRRSLR
jgi:hypothetical protein